MVEPRTGLELQDRTYKRKNYPACFVGKDSVDWLLKALKGSVTSREDAVQIMQKLVDSGYFISLLGASNFRDEPNAFYCFSDQLQSNQLPVAPLTPSNIRVRNRCK
jgi:hypothetical protein